MEDELLKNGFFSFFFLTITGVTELRAVVVQTNPRSLSLLHNSEIVLFCTKQSQIFFQFKKKLVILPVQLLSQVEDDSNFICVQ